jgi:DNA-binding protein HU-beta/integration host factor subunit beta
MTNITKKDIIESASDKTGLTQIDTRIVVESFLEAISKSLQNGKNIEIRGFGRFKLKHRNARQARNPRTGEAVNIEAGIKPVFKASRELTIRVNNAHKESEIAA